MALRVEGEIRSPREFGYEDLAALPGQVEDIGTLIPGREGRAVRLESILEAVGVTDKASRVTLESTDGSFSQNAPLAALRDAVLLYRLDEGPLPQAKGGPIRFLVPNFEACNLPGVDRCTNVKSLGLIRLAGD